MDERAFYTEKEETRKVKLVCPSCHKDFEFPVRWKVCRKKKELPRGASPEDRKKFDHARPTWFGWTTSLPATNAANASKSPANPQCSSTTISAIPSPTPKISEIGDLMLSSSESGERRSECKPSCDLSASPFALLKSPDTSQKTLRSTAETCFQSLPCCLRSSAW